jgi:hypothetical protein
MREMKKVLAYSLLLVAGALPLGGCLSISWQDDSPTTVASAAPAPNGAPAAPKTVACDYAHGWDSSSAARDIYGNPKEYQCPTAQ